MILAVSRSHGRCRSPSSARSVRPKSSVFEMLPVVDLA